MIIIRQDKKNKKKTINIDNKIKQITQRYTKTKKTD